MARIKIQMKGENEFNTLTFEAEGTGEWVVEVSKFIGNSLILPGESNFEIEETNLRTLQQELDSAEAAVSQGKSYEGTLVRATITQS